MKKLLVIAIAASAVLFFPCFSTARTVDISQPGQVRYGCALATHLRSTHQSLGDWRDLLSGDNPAINQILAISGLFHGLAPSTNANSLQKIGMALLVSTQRLDNKKLGLELDAAIIICRKLGFGSPTAAPPTDAGSTAKPSFNGT